MSKVGTWPAEILDVVEDESRGGAYIGLEVAIPAIREHMERRLYVTEDALPVTKRILQALGIDLTKPPIPQLRAIIGKPVTVKVKRKMWEGNEDFEIWWMWAGSRPDNGSVSTTIHQALGIDADTESGAADAAAGKKKTTLRSTT